MDAVYKIETAGRYPRMSPCVWTPFNITYGEDGKPVVLFQVERNSLNPVADGSLLQNIAQYSFSTSVPSNVVVTFEHTEARVLVTYERKTTSAERLEPRMGE